MAALPPESLTACKAAGIPQGWTIEALVTADVYTALTGQPHPARPKPGPTPGTTTTPASAYASTRAALEAQRERLAKQRS